ncbi:hypothetical protein BJ742DRAFT_389852 [Cladochytrium replicatum]|nr:hypothetical protein BJ742DRAFT_389852 [Cladochytrium replicatum]
MPTLLSLPDDVLQGPLISYAIPHRYVVTDAFAPTLLKCQNLCSNHLYAVVLSQTCRRLRTVLLPVLLRENPVELIKPNYIPMLNSPFGNGHHDDSSDRLQRFHFTFLLNTPCPSPLLGHFRKLYLGSRGGDTLDAPLTTFFARFDWDDNDAQRLTDVVRILSPTIQTLYLWRVNDAAYLEEVCTLFGMHGNLTELVVYFDFIWLKNGVEPPIFFRILGAFLAKLPRLRSLHIKCTGNTVSEREISPLSEGLFSLCNNLVSFCWEWTGILGSYLDEKSLAIIPEDFVGALIGRFVGTCTSLRTVRLRVEPDRLFHRPLPSSHWADILSKMEANRSTGASELELKEDSCDEKLVDRTWVLHVASVLEQGFSNLRSLSLGFSAVVNEGYVALGLAIATLPSLEKLCIEFKRLEGNVEAVLPLFSGISRASRLTSLEVSHNSLNPVDEVLPEYFHALIKAVADNGAISTLALRMFAKSFQGLEILVDSLMRHASRIDSHLRTLGLSIHVMESVYRRERTTLNFHEAWSTLLRLLVEMPLLQTLDLGGTFHHNLFYLAERVSIATRIRNDISVYRRNLRVIGRFE